MHSFSSSLKLVDHHHHSIVSVFFKRLQHNIHITYTIFLINERSSEFSLSSFWWSRPICIKCAQWKKTVSLKHTHTQNIKLHYMQKEKIRPQFVRFLYRCTLLCECKSLCGGSHFKFLIVYFIHTSSRTQTILVFKYWNNSTHTFYFVFCWSWSINSIYILVYCKIG